MEGKSMAVSPLSSGDQVSVLDLPKVVKEDPKSNAVDNLASQKVDSSTAPSKEKSLAEVVAKMFGKNLAQQNASIGISFKVDKHVPNSVITILTDPKTGEEIAQFPAQIMVKIAQIFDIKMGATVDKTA